MKKTTILFLSLLLIQAANSQILEPVKWSYGKKKIGDNTYELHLKANLNEGWHIYAQKQPGNAVAIPTRIVFDKNKSLQLIGQPKELGTLEKWEDKLTGIAAYQYAKTVDFIQIVKLKNPNITAVSGVITFQTCGDKMCLPPENLAFCIVVK